MPEFDVRIELETSPVVNMERDERLARTLPQGSAIIRLYSWKPHAISLGYSQPIDQIDQAKAVSASIEVVRRPTGGRAVLHSDELTYSAVFRVAQGVPVGRLHDHIVGLLVEGLKMLGPEAEQISITTPDSHGTREAYRAVGPTRVSCFASTSRHEATYYGKKFIGSAQRRFGDVVLQHGSILLSDDHVRIAEFLVGDNQARQQMRTLLSEQTTSLSAMFGRRITSEMAANALAQHLSHAIPSKVKHESVHVVY